MGPLENVTQQHDLSPGQEAVKTWLCIDLDETSDIVVHMHGSDAWSEHLWLIFDTGLLQVC